MISSDGGPLIGSGRSGGACKPEGRKGFALIAVLWLVAALLVLISLGLAPTLISLRAAENRIGKVRGTWAAWGCVALLQARHDENADLFITLDSLSLARTTWCDVESVDPGVRVNPNLVDSVGLFRVLRDSVQVSSLLDWIDEDDLPRRLGAERRWYASRRRPTPRNAGIADVREIRLVRGFEGTETQALEGLFTVRGEGGVSPNRAGQRALASISVLPEGAADDIISHRTGDRPFRTTEELVLRLGLEPTISEFRRLVRSLSFDDDRGVFRIRGSADLGRRTVRSELVVTLAKLEDRLALTRVEVR